jgi:hypothetical protein
LSLSGENPVSNFAFQVGQPAPLQPGDEKLAAAKKEADKEKTTFMVGICTSRIQLTHSLKAPGFNP